jgi:hypothetical protein
VQAGGLYLYFVLPPNTNDNIRKVKSYDLIIRFEQQQITSIVSCKTYSIIYKSNMERQLEFQTNNSIFFIFSVYL